MALEINLLPREQTGDKNVEKVLGLLNKIALSLTVIFIITVLIGGGAYFFLSSRLQEVRTEQETLTSNIQSLQSTEASLILLRDRIQKVQTVLGSRASEPAFAKQKQIIAEAPAEVVFTSNQVEVGKSNLGVNIANSRNLVNLMSFLLGRGDLTSLIVNELSFNSFSGYTLEIGVY